MTIVLASGNKHKISEFQSILKRYIPDAEVVSMKDVGIVDDIVEDGTTFEENAAIKARAVASHGFIGVGDDSGLSVRALDGAPGIYSARFAGEHGNDAKNNEKLLDLMKDKTDRAAAFVCAISCAFPSDLDCADFTVRGECEGSILDECRGHGGFGYDPLFFVAKHQKSFAQLSPDEKNEISHRAVATELFAKRFIEELSKKEK